MHPPHQPQNAYDILNERGFIAQCTHEDELRELMAKEPVTFYIGYDPTADSLTAGHFLTLMALAHLQKAGHRPITLMGTGTGMVGDPSDRTDMRRVMSAEEVANNIACFKKQFSRFIDYTDDKAIMVENAWLLDLKYVDFIRNIGVHFSINRMLAAECYKSRLDDGLTFFEFNYMLMQAYDFLELYRRHGCRVQMGGNDQWSNIIAGVELIRKTENASAYGFTLTLLTANANQKMGKTMGNAVWLDPAKTSPYVFYQYWRNTEDSSVIKNLKLLTFLPLDEINEMAKWQGAQLNRAKEILAYEITKAVHGAEEAERAQSSAKALFSEGGDLDAMPTTEISLDGKMNVLDLLEAMKLIPSRGEGRRLLAQGGIKINNEKIDTHEHIITKDDFKDGYILVQKGKKIFHRGQRV
ncbi:MAG: tyrosine--tRNA ligase [Defluviitaleaceae bacterium]|nr:tyrosine--tRNA ligase [Defluviitaleaceae bacterium]